MEFSVVSDYDAQISIFSGESCALLFCVNGNDESPMFTEDIQSSVIVMLESDVTYYILIHGFNEAVGTFEVQVDAVDVVSNDLCTQAVELEIGTLEAGTTVNALDDDGLDVCGT